MKRPVTSLCRRPEKKDRLRGSLSPVREQFPPTGTLCEGQAELPGKIRPNEGAKTVSGGGQDCAQAAPWGNSGQWEVSGAGKAPHWAHAGAEGTPGRKNRRTSCAGWCLEGAALGFCRGREHIQAQKQPPAGAGGCLDAGYGCYLPRAIRVIWMHRVGSTARPRIMPS